jgi:hypothetical protein
MRRTLFTTAIVASALGLGLSAQSTPTPTTGTPGSTQSQPTSREAGRDAMQSVTLTGCIQKGESAGKFLLTNFRQGSGSTASTSTSGTPSTTGTSGAAMSGQLAGLTQVHLKSGDNDVKFDEHVGHRVEITGKFDKEGSFGPSSMSGTTGTSGTSPSGTSPSGTSPSGTTPSTASGTSGAAGSATSARNPTVEVKSLRMVSATCS